MVELLCYDLSKNEYMEGATTVQTLTVVVYLLLQYVRNSARVIENDLRHADKPSDHNSMAKTLGISVPRPVPAAQEVS